MSFSKTAAIRAERRKSAEARQAEYDKLTLQQKLDKLPPEPHAAKQRAKLNALAQKVAEKAEAAKLAATAKAEAKAEKTEKSNKKGNSQ
jgi:hypothetical protein